MVSGSWLYLLLISLIGVNADESSSLARFSELYDTKVILLSVLEEYIDFTEHRLQLLKRRAAAFSKQHKEASVDISRYFSDPINGYLLIKLLRTEWKQTESLMFDFIDEVKENMKSHRKNLKFPTEKDLDDVADALISLQGLSPETILEIDEFQNNAHLSADDCFERGIQSFNNEDFYHTFIWMIESLLRNYTTTPTRRGHLLEYLAYSTYMLGNEKQALLITEEWLTFEPDNPSALRNKLFYQDQNGNSESSKTVEQKVNDREYYNSSDTTYVMLCQNNSSLSPAVLAQLKCRYAHRDVPFLRIGPLKEEEAYLKPKILLYRDIISDKEINIIKKIAEPRLTQAEVVNQNQNGTMSLDIVVTSYRKAKAAWISNKDNDIVPKINRRLEDMTSLSALSAEDLHIVSYGIGDFYKPHFDFLDPHLCLKTGNRIATVLFYMNDVLEGGATVFPTLNLSVWPEKGTAVFWHNLLHNGENDYSTIHAACPVVAGSKWVATKWIREKGQEFRRPCELKNEVYEEETGHLTT